MLIISETFFLAKGAFLFTLDVQSFRISTLNSFNKSFKILQKSDYILSTERLHTNLTLFYFGLFTVLPLQDYF